MNPPSDQPRPLGPPPSPPPAEAASADWFREPTPREHRIAAALFVGFGVFFVLLFFVLLGWWFRWVILALGGISVLHGLWHAARARRPRGANPD